MKPLSSKRKNDLRLILLLLLAAGLLTAAILLFQSEGEYAVVIQDGVEIARYPLSVEDRIVIHHPDGGYNILIIQNGYADVAEADCPDELCVLQRKIHANGETIVCLPHKLVIQIVSSVKQEIDAVT